MKHQCVFLAVLSLALASASAVADTAAEPVMASLLSFDRTDWAGAAAMADEALDQARGRKTVFNTNEVDGQLYNNEAQSNVTGSNFVSGGSFSGMSGFSTVIQNSGNNVLIQNATVLNLQFQ